MNQSFGSVISRMKQTGNLKNDSAVARALNVSAQAISNYKRLGRFPAGHIVRFAERYGVSVDWLLSVSGVEPSGTGGGAAQESLEQSIYTSRLITVLSSKERAVGEAAKHCIDALFKMARERDGSVSPARSDEKEQYRKATVKRSERGA